VGNVNILLENMKKSSKKKSTRSYHHGDLKKALMEEGLKMIEKQGAENLTLRDLARTLGISHNAPYRHFTSREDLLAALTLEGAKLFVNALTEGHNGIYKTEKDFSRMGEGYIRFAVNFPEYYRLLFFQKHFDWNNYPDLLSVMNDAFGALMGAVQDLQKADVIHKDDPMMISMGIFSYIHGFTSLMMSKRLPPGNDPVIVFNHLMLLYLRGLRK